MELQFHLIVETTSFQVQLLHPLLSAALPEESGVEVGPQPADRHLPLIDVFPSLRPAAYSSTDTGKRVS